MTVQKALPRRNYFIIGETHKVAQLKVNVGRKVSADALFCRRQAEKKTKHSEPQISTEREEKFH